MLLNIFKLTTESTLKLADLHLMRLRHAVKEVSIASIPIQNIYLHRFAIMHAMQIEALLNFKTS